MMNSFSKVRIEFHILQSFPVTCLNRDDLGSPKMAIVGGVSRARVSSQCWKRQVRMSLPEFNIHLAVRTKHLQDLLCKACVEKGADQDQAELGAKKISETLSKDTLFFVSDGEIADYADYAISKNFSFDKNLLKDLVKLSKKHHIKAADGLDIALFGRMVAKAPEMNVEAACAFSHAISTHKVNADVDFFTALDDFSEQDHEGSAHMGAIEYNSATYYRYVCLDLGQLAETLGIDETSREDLSQAIAAFIKALYVAVPAARQNTQSGQCGWDYAKVLVRKGQPLQFACDKPVRPDLKNGGGYLAPSIEALTDFLQEKERMSGSLFGKIADYELSADHGDIDELIQTVQKALSL